MTSILIIYTGGTIGMIENPETGALENFDMDQFRHHVPELKRFNFNIDAITFESPIDSSDMEPHYWVKIAKMIDENYDRYNGFVVLHGTDTMAYTAAALSYMIQNSSKPIVITGSQKPINMDITDAKTNLLDSFIYAADEKSQGVVIVFDGKVIQGTRAKKTKTKSKTII